MKLQASDLVAALWANGSDRSAVGHYRPRCLLCFALLCFALLCFALLCFASPYLIVACGQFGSSLTLA
jgi:hypothetical protein